jgi:hypothetical protein
MWPIEEKKEVTHWSRVQTEKLIVIDLHKSLITYIVKKLATFYGTKHILKSHCSEPA